MKSPLKTLRWLLFGAGFALIPILFGFLRMATRGQSLSISGVTSRGELLLISAGIGGAAIGELIASGTKKRPGAKLACGSACAAVLLLSGLWFSDISSLLDAGQAVNHRVISYGSLVVLALTLIASGGCVALSEV